MGTRQHPGQDDGDTGVATEVRKKQHLDKPPLFRVLMHNDNYTTMDFVVAVLIAVFHRSEADAFTIMLHVHEHGYGVAGVYTRDVAETKITRVHQLARENEFPLRLTMEPEEG